MTARKKAKASNSKNTPESISIIQFIPSSVQRLYFQIEVEAQQPYVLIEFDEVRLRTCSKR